MIYRCPKCGRVIVTPDYIDLYRIRYLAYCRGTDKDEHLEVRMKEHRDG